MSAHTPGKWTAVYQPSRDAEIATIAWCADWCIGIPTPGVPGGNYRDLDWGDPAADARLIAAAPELLDALRPFAALLAEHHDDLPDDRPIFGINDAVITAGDLRRARAAIAKATGAE